jgi:hypothetical protein
MSPRAAVAAIVVLLAAGCGGGGKPAVVVGAVEDSAKWGDAPRQMQLARESGMRAIVLSAVWRRGLRAPAANELDALERAVDAAVEEDVRPIVAVYSFSAETPLSAAEQDDFAAFAAAIPRELPDVRDVVVGNEPNLNLFWMPQFGPDGSDAAAAAFVTLLAKAYDALKEVDEDVNVIGAGLSARGSDDADAARQTHSPTRFLLDLGRAYRASGRDKPLMDMLSIHPYGESPRVPPSFAHPRSTSIGIADYGKLVHLLGQAFDGTAQQGGDLPIVYGEYGVETRIPAAKKALYTGHEAVAAVDEATQARYYRAAVRTAVCQPTVAMLVFFHVNDEQRLEGLQSGVRYADATPKTSLEPVREAADRAAAGCPTDDRR